jgi:hypothetical protein
LCVSGAIRGGQFKVPWIGWQGVVMARSGSQSLRATQHGSKLARENTNQGYSICADLVNTRSAGLRIIQSSARSKAVPQSRYFFEGAAFGNAGFAIDSAGILATDCWRASNFSVRVAICLESFFVSACWAASWS